VSSRDFLASLAFKVFQCTQYLRPAVDLWHTTEPDICHEVIGHVPMLCDQQFAEFSHQIGLASLGADEDEIKKISMLYWFTIEMGVCKEGDKGIKVFGAAILSSVFELKNAISSKPTLKPLMINDELFLQPFVDRIFQPVYFISESFEDALEKIEKFASHEMKKSFRILGSDENGKIRIELKY